MEIITSIQNLFGAFGLSSAAGLNAYIPLLAVGLLQRYQYIGLNEPYALLGSTPVLLILAVLALIDFVADKVPAVDHATHVVGGLVSPVAGAIAFASQNNIVSEIHPLLALGAGFLMAGGFHATRAAIRPVATATTAGFANPFLSLVEDIVALVLSILAFFAPLIAFLLFLILLFVIIRAWRTVRRRVGAIRR